MTKKLKAFIMSIALSTAAIPAAFAQNNPYGNVVPSGSVNLGGPADVLNLMYVFLGWAFAFFFVLAVFFFLWAAFIYLRAGGDQEKLTEAKHRLLYGIIAIVVALLAGSIPTIVKNIL
jgi:hypothetical protein